MRLWMLLSLLLLLCLLLLLLYLHLHLRLHLHLHLHLLLVLLMLLLLLLLRRRRRRRQGVVRRGRSVVGRKALLSMGLECRRHWHNLALIRRRRVRWRCRHICPCAKNRFPTSR